MDEPFGVDAQTRGKLQRAAADLAAAAHDPCCSSHSIYEALLLADRPGVHARPGRVAADIKVDLRPRAPQ